MTGRIDLTGRVAIVTGAGGGLGRAHALLLASRGARVVVNDLGGSLQGEGYSAAPAETVAAEIRASGGEAIANAASVTDAQGVEAMVSDTIERWGSVDILVNNAGFLRDRSFAKMSLDDFRAVVDVHLMGAVTCSKAVWDHMRAKGYGRIVFTTSSSGLFGNFGQSNYAAAKMALVGLMQTLGLEGAKANIKVNCLAPSGATRMLEGLLSPDMLAALRPEAVSPAVLALVADDAPTRTIVCAGAGSFELAHVSLTKGIHIAGGRADAADELLERFDEVAAMDELTLPENGFEQVRHEISKAGTEPFPDSWGKELG
jgi:NAD(P)-dependent dehydrogenase (short-subunit alcohol dehydrogenase family)